MNPQPQSVYHHGDWRWPINLEAYDLQAAELTEAERMQLSHVLAHPRRQITKQTKAALHRLLVPVDDILTNIQAPPGTCFDVVRLLSLEMYRRGTAFWVWSEEEWIESICQDAAAFALRYEQCGVKVDEARVRRSLPLIAYLLCPRLNLDVLFRFIEFTPLARKVFGKETVDQALQRLTQLLQNWGYEEVQKENQPFTGCICYLLLRNRSPYLEDLTIELLVAVAQSCTLHSVQRFLFQVSRALHALGIIEQPLLDKRGLAVPVVSGKDNTVSEEWLSWCERWRKQSLMRDRSTIYYQLLKVGRWLGALHPEVTSPAQWTYELAAEFVAAANEMKVGEWITTYQQGRLKAKQQLRIGLRPNAKEKLLRTMRTFLRDCQEWHWIPTHINPHRAFRTPRSLRSLIGPNPRVVDKEFWAKILWAAMNLQEADLPLSGGYPLELVRAIAVVWCFSALRSDEIMRLRVGCIRWQYEDVMIPETSALLPKDVVCFLDIPVNKTVTAYTKAVHPLVGKRINEWEQIRPREQPQGLDSTTSEIVQFLFSSRGMRVSKVYINESLIPLLCRKAGIPEQDSRGKITSHRARATIASMLYNAKEPLSIYELKEYLGHKHLASTQHYVQVDPTKLASKVATASYLEQNLATIEVLLDQDAVLSGRASRGDLWKFYDLGHGWCTNPFWADCVHRMACAKCPYYRPKDALAEQLVEGKANLMRMLEFVHLTDDEKLLVTEGIELHQELFEKLADVPTPAGPTPRELENSHPPETKVIPLKTIRRNKKKQNEP
jgi:integrase